MYMVPDCRASSPRRSTLKTLVESLTTNKFYFKHPFYGLFRQKENVAYSHRLILIKLINQVVALFE